MACRSSLCIYRDTGLFGELIGLDTSRTGAIADGYSLRMDCPSLGYNGVVVSSNTLESSFETLSNSTLDIREFLLLSDC